MCWCVYKVRLCESVQESPEDILLDFSPASKKEKKREEIYPLHASFIHRSINAYQLQTYHVKAVTLQFLDMYI